MNYRIYLRLDPAQLTGPDTLMPSLQQLLANGAVATDSEPFEAVLCRSCGIGKQHDWPAAALSWLGEGNDPGDYYWLYADPVHFSLQRDHFSLTLPAPMPLPQTQSLTLLDSLNRHFYEQGLHFHVASSGRWYLRLAESVDMATFSIAQAGGRDVRDFMPQGADAEKWRSLLNEMQMLLHGQAINQAREDEGQPVINSLWLSCGGFLPEKPQTADKTICANDALARGAAMLSETRLLPLAGNFAEHLQSLAGLDGKQEDVVLVLEELRQAEQEWFAPLLAALKGRRITRLNMEIFIQNRHLHAELKPLDLWKFWRKPRPLETYFW
jgi:hypothetical protein